MLKDAGATAVIVGHSERRTLHEESDEDVKAKAQAAIRQALSAILCVGETSEERQAGATIAQIRRQLEGSLPDLIDAAKLVIAYEPVCGRSAHPPDADYEGRGAGHEMIRNHLISNNKYEGEKVRNPLWGLGEARQCQGADGGV